MAGGYYTALSGMRARLDALDRLASDIANAQHRRLQDRARRHASRPTGRRSATTLQSAIDVATA